MKLKRVLLFGSLAVLVLLVALVALAFNSGVQTWAVRRALKGQPDLSVEVGRVSVGLQSVVLSQITLRQPGLKLTLPEVTSELSVIDAVSRKVRVRRVKAHGWTLDLTAPAPLAAGGSPERRAVAGYFAVLSGVNGNASAAPAPKAEAFAGIFGLLRLPVELSLEDADLAGAVIFPTAAGQPAGRAVVTVTGGKLGAAREGRFRVEAKAEMSGAVSQLTATSDIGLRMDAPDSIDRVSAVTDLVAVGSRFPGGARLKAALLAERGAQGVENYRVMVEAEQKALLDLRAQLPAGATQLGGAIVVSVRDTDLEPFILGRTLPAFAATVDAKFGVTTKFDAFSAQGALEVVASRLEVISPHLKPVGTLSLASTFAVEHTPDLLRVNALQARVSGAAPLASIDVRQAFGWVLKTGELKVADPARELVSISLEGVPLPWAQPYLEGVVVEGGDARGSFLVRAAGGGYAIRPQVPLTLSPFSLSKDGKAILRNVGLTVSASADVTPDAWQAEVTELVAREGATTLWSLNVKAGQAGGAKQPLKATGRLSVDLPSVLTQPVVNGAAVLSRGTLRGDFTASLGATQELAAQLVVSDLVSGVEERFPRVTVDLRADVRADGSFVARAPILVERDDRKSDVVVGASGRTEKEGITLDAQVASNRMYLDDVKILGAPFALAGSSETATPGSAPTAPDKAPVWKGVSGKMSLSLAEVVYSPDLTIRDVTGSVRIGPAAVTLEALKAVLGTGGQLAMSGGLKFDASNVDAYRLKADLAVANLDSGSTLKALKPNNGLPLVEGTFDVKSSIDATSGNLGTLAEMARGDVRISSKGGIFRPLPASYLETFVNAKNQLAKRGEQAGALSAIAGVIGARLPSALGGAAGKAQQLVERMNDLEGILRLIAEVRFDQLTLDVGGDSKLDTVLRDLTVTAPELRFVGTGGLKYRPNVPLWKQALSLKLTGAARGRAAEVMKKGNLLGESVDSLGYIPLSMDVNIDGTADNPDTSKLVVALVDKVLGVQLQPGDVERIRQGDVLVLLNVLGQLK
jgi:hypothetical protein